MSGTRPEGGALHRAIRRVAEALEMDVRPLAAGSVQPTVSGADRFSVILPISTPQERPTEMRMNELQQLIDRGEYRVDTHAVADAILRRILPAADRPEAPQADDQS
jgi:hypothetical protein